MKKFYICTFNLNTGAITNLPKLYDNREEAILAGQDYVKNREYEDSTVLFYRVHFIKDMEEVSKNEITNIYEIVKTETLRELIEEDEDDEGDCDHDCYLCPYALIYEDYTR